MASSAQEGKRKGERGKGGNGTNKREGGKREGERERGGDMIWNLRRRNGSGDDWRKEVR